MKNPPLARLWWARFTRTLLKAKAGKAIARKARGARSERI